MKRLKGFKDNYTTLNDYISIAQYKPIDKIHKVVNILKSNKELKYFKQEGNQYKFMFRNGGIIILSLNQLLKTWYVYLNTTGLSKLSYFSLHRTYKHFMGIKRQSYVEDNKGFIKYSHKDGIMFNANDNNLNNDIKALLH